MRKKIFILFIFILFLTTSFGCSNTSKPIDVEDYELKSIASTDELKKLVKQPSTPWWRWWEKGVVFDSMAPTADSAENKTTNHSTETSQTNVQVAGVDESDIVKNDNRYIYIANYYGISIVDTVTEEVYNKVVENFSPSELFLYNDYLVVLGTEWSTPIYTNNTSKPSLAVDVVEFGRCFYYHSQVFKAIVFNVADKENIEIAREFTLKDGYFMQARMIENTLYLMLNTYSVYDYAKDEVILPTFTDTSQSQSSQTLPLRNIKVIGDDEYYSSYTVLVSFEIDNKNAPYVDAFLGYFGIVYSSLDNLYLTKLIYTYNTRNTKDSTEPVSNVFWPSYYNTAIYRFNYQDHKMVYQTKTFVKGALHNQFSLDEYEGVLRVAHTDNYYNQETKRYSESFVSTFDVSKPGELKFMASVGGLGINEQIYSTRFNGPLGYVVTFQTIDPLYVVDLSDPANPTVKSELKSPGVSDYLHMVNDNLLLGIGRDTELNQYNRVTVKGVKVSLFDVTNQEETKEVDILKIEGEYSYTELQYNHKALLTLPSRQIYALPVYAYFNNYHVYKQGMYVFKVDEVSMKLTYLGLIGHDTFTGNKDYYYYNYQSTVVRGVIINGKIYTISQAYVGINELDDNLTLIKLLPLARNN